MRRRWTLLILALALVAAPARSVAQDAEARYQGLLAAAKAGQAVDWQAMRFAYADRPSFNVMDTSQNAALKTMFTALNGGDFAGALAAAKREIDADYVDADAHLVAAIADDKLGDAAGSARERAIALGLWKSMETGDGKTAASAFTVISVGEEYSLMRAHQRRVTEQALVNAGGHSYDVLTTVAQGGGDVQTCYFLIDRVLAAEAAMLKPR
jgi:hypothetical protein